MTLPSPWPVPTDRTAALAAFRTARYGLFVHYGLYSLLGRGEWVMYKERIPVAEYQALQGRFTAERFDAEAIARLAVAAGMRYVVFTTRHHDSFSLFRTGENAFHSLAAPAGRDLVGELAAACRRHGLALYLYYSLGADWTHPYFHGREPGTPWARPDYAQPQPAYRFQADADFRRYVDFMLAQLGELLGGAYGAVAGVWFDLISDALYRPELYPLDEIYGLVRRLQPHALISFKQGADGSEDYLTCERRMEPLQEVLAARGAPAAVVERAARVWAANAGKPREVCTTLLETAWGHHETERHRDAAEVWELLAHCAGHDANLCLNVGLLPDGSVHAGDAATLRAVGERLAAQGFPAGDTSADARLHGMERTQVA